VIAIAVTLFMVSPTWALAQAASPEPDDPRNGGPRCISTPVRDAPFSAEAVMAPASEQRKD
jgi:hypothetical protein